MNYLYAHILNRAPDHIGMEYFTEKCGTLGGFLHAWWGMGRSSESRMLPSQVLRMLRALLHYATRRRATTGNARSLGPLRIGLDTPGGIGIGSGGYQVAGWAVNLQWRSAADVRVIADSKVYYPRPERRGDIWLAFAPERAIPAEVGFSIKLALPTGLHRITIEIENTDGTWLPVANPLLVSLPFLSLPRHGITRGHRAAPAINTAATAHHIDSLKNKPHFTVVIDERFQSRGLEETASSVRRQSYPHFDICAFGAFGTKIDRKTFDQSGAQEESFFQDARGDFLVFLQAGQTLAVDALYRFAAEINSHPDLDLVYGDEIHGKETFYKPGWSPDYLETLNYIGFAACFRKSIARACFTGYFHLYDFVLRFTERTVKIRHVPDVLGRDESPADAIRHYSGLSALDVAALQARLDRVGRHGSAREHGQHKGCLEVRLDLQQRPLVSIVIPTAGKTVAVGDRQLDLVVNAVSQIRCKSTYDNFEIIVVDNNDLSNDQINALAAHGCTRLAYREHSFNIAKKLNIGANAAKGKLLLLLNDDIEIIAPSWIEKLVEQFEKPHVGIAGGKLVYPGGRLQHAGIVFRSGEPIHTRRHFSRHEAGYYFGTCGVRNYSAVTGACMMVSAHTYRELGGFNEEFPLNYNDIDFCLRVRERGLHIVYVPGAELTHMESLTRPSAPDTSGQELYRRRWAQSMTMDEFYNEQFLRDTSPFA